MNLTRPRFMLALIPAVALLVSAREADTATFELAGYVVGVSSTDGDVVLVRGQRSIPVRRPMALEAGDKLLISGRARAVVQSNRTRQRIEIDARNSPYLMGGAPPPPSIVQQFLDELLGKKADRKDVLRRPPVRQNFSDSKGVGDCPPAASSIQPLARAKALGVEQQRVWSSQPLFLAWTAGQAPFTIRLINGSKTGRVLAANICDNGGVFAVAPSVGATASIEVSDAIGTKISWRLRSIAPPASLPDGPTNASEDAKALADGISALNEPDGSRAVMGLTILNSVADKHFVAWRLVRAALDNEAI